MHEQGRLFCWTRSQPPRESESPVSFYHMLIGGGPDADRHAKPLIDLAVEGAL